MPTHEPEHVRTVLANKRLKTLRESLEQMDRHHHVAALTAYEMHRNEDHKHLIDDETGEPFVNFETLARKVLDRSRAQTYNLRTQGEVLYIVSRHLGVELEDLEISVRDAIALKKDDRLMDRIQAAKQLGDALEDTDLLEAFNTIKANARADLKEVDFEPLPDADETVTTEPAPTPVQKKTTPNQPQTNSTRRWLTKIATYRPVQLDPQALITEAKEHQDLADELTEVLRTFQGIMDALNAEYGNMENWFNEA